MRAGEEGGDRGGIAVSSRASADRPGRSRNMAASCSAYRGEPEARSRTAGDEFGACVAEAGPRERSRMPPSASAAREGRCAGEPAQARMGVGPRSRPAVTTTSSGRPAVLSARCQRKATNPLRPVQVLDDQDGRPRLWRSVRGSVATRRRSPPAWRRLCRTRSPTRGPRRSTIQVDRRVGLDQTASSLPQGRLIVRLEDPGVGPTISPRAPSPIPSPVRGASPRPATSQVGEGLHVPAELADQAALADPRSATIVTTSTECVVRTRLNRRMRIERSSSRPTNGVVSATSGPCGWAMGAMARHAATSGSLLPFAVERRDRRIRDRPERRLPGTFSRHHDAVDGGGPLEPRGGVHRVAGHHVVLSGPAAGEEHGPVLMPIRTWSPRSSARTGLRGSPGKVQDKPARDRLRGRRALRTVPSPRHRGIARRRHRGEIDLASQERRRSGTRKARTSSRSQGLGAGGEPGEIGEQDRDDPPLLADRRRGGRRRRTLLAVLSTLTILVRARRTDGHGAHSVRTEFVRSGRAPRTDSGVGRPGSAAYLVLVVVSMNPPTVLGGPRPPGGP